MKQIILLLTPFILFAQSYTFSGGQENVAQIVAGKILTKAYAKAGIKIKNLFLPPEQALESSNSGQSDGELARIKDITKMYPNLVQVPVSLVSVAAFAYSKNHTLKINSWSDLSGHNFTVVKGTKFIEKATKNLQKETVNSFKEAFDRLNRGETEIIIVPKKAAVRIIVQKNYKEIKSVSPALMKVKLYHFVHKKNIHLIPIITPILQKMQDSGELTYLEKAYLQNSY